MNNFYIRYEVIKKQNQKTIMILPKSINKCGCSSVVWNYKTGSALFTFLLSDHALKFLQYTGMLEYAVDKAIPFEIVDYFS